METKRNCKTSDSVLARHHRLVTLLIMLFALLMSCSAQISGGRGDDGPDDDTGDSAGQNAFQLPTLKWEISKDVAPSTREMDPLEEDGPARPLGAVAGEDIPVGSFVKNELVIFSDDDLAVEDFADRVGGDVVLTEDPKASEVDGPKMHLVVVDEPQVEMDSLGDHLAALKLLEGEKWEENDSDDGEHGDEVTMLFSDKQAAALVALAAREAVEGDLTIGLNWVGEPAAIPLGTEEGENGFGVYRDAYDFSWFGRESGMKTGVTDAWDLLHEAGRLENEVKIAILDMGFKVTSDLEDVSSTTVWPGFGPLNRENDFNCSGGHPCPWHGTDVAGAAMGVEDNQFGSAGPAGPVAKPLLVYTTYDYLASITAVYRAKNRGAKIANMSYSAPVPWWLKWTTAGFRHATSAVRDSGVLLFAAAGNEGRNVDARTCFLGHCWEKTFYTPCENAGVTCVGGLSGPENRESSSNYGEKSVDLYGPWCVSVGPNPAEDTFHTSCGTSISSPFVAGVAALVWAANPAMSASNVADILANTADGYLEQKVNAYEGVLSAIGTLKFLEIINPTPGDQFILGIPSPLVGEVSFISQPAAPIDVELSWHSSLDGDLGSGQVTVSRSEGDLHSERVYLDHLLSEGHHQITLTAAISMPGPFAGIQPPFYLESQSDVLVTNPAPTVEIELPQDGETFCEGQTIMFRARGEDANQTLPEEAYSWSSSYFSGQFPIFLTLGNGTTMSTDTLPVGQRTVHVGVTDDGGQSASDSVDIEILPAGDPQCSDLPPQVIITEPAPGAVIMATGYDATGTYADIALGATASDHEDADGSLTVEWYLDSGELLATGRSAVGRVYMTDSCGSEHTITARVTDSDQNTAEDEVTVYVYIVC